MKDSKVRIFGSNIEVPDESGRTKFGYRIWVAADEEVDKQEGMLTERKFEGGLYAVRTVAAASPRTIQDGWDSLLAEWLPKSTFESGNHACFEEFIAYNGSITKMKLCLPVQRKRNHEPIELVERPESSAFYFRGAGADPQRVAEQRLIDWYIRGGTGTLEWTAQGHYYMSYSYGIYDERYWWENGIILSNPTTPAPAGLSVKRMHGGKYVSTISKTYGLLTGVLERLHRWIADHDGLMMDNGRQWFAEYHTIPGMDVERDTLVRIYIPVLHKERDLHEKRR